ncbi:MAG TPA: DNA-3-methyladenine glycosylase [Sporichthyaceae bacterium]|nr:DNA-3-methyladenine glycosylase [Sporichthyaceae bacterium]
MTSARPLPRSFLNRPVLTVAPALLGALLEHDGVVIRLTEVEAYDGGEDPASHAFRGPTRRNDVMFGPPGHLYLYFTYGMHWCSNVVCGPVGRASAVLLRAGEVVAGEALARSHRPGVVAANALARGPANLVRALGLGPADNGRDVCAPGPVRLARGPTVTATSIRSGPRVGIRVAADRPWRFWLADEPSVSAYRPAARRPAPDPPR